MPTVGKTIMVASLMGVPTPGGPSRCLFLLQCVAMSSGVLRYFAVCCSALQGCGAPQPGGLFMSFFVF